MLTSGVFAAEASSSYEHEPITHAYPDAMARPPCCRHVARFPPHDRFGPAGVSGPLPEPLRLGLDAYEALRLADLERLQQDEAARRMGVSRQTFGRILETARGTVARALVEGRALSIEGGPICPPPHPGWRCPKWGDRGPASPGDCPRRRDCASPECQKSTDSVLPSPSPIPPGES